MRVLSLARRRQSNGRGLAAKGLAGAAGGLYGAAAMSVLRLGMHRAGLVDKMVPDVMEEWLAERLGVDPPGGRVGHQTAAQLLHLAYGAGWGGIAGLLQGRPGRTGLWQGAAFGLGLWGLGMLAMLPAIRAARPAWRSTLAENAINIVAHLVYGISVQLLLEEPARQPHRGRTSDRDRWHSRVG